MSAVVGLHGYAGVGKDTFADALVQHYNFTKVAFADPVREILYRMSPLIRVENGRTVPLRELVDSIGWTEAKHLYRDVRELLVALGMGARESLGSTVWMDEAARRSGNATRIVFPDVRLMDEALFLRRTYGAILVHVVRPGVEAAHPQEIATLPLTMMDFVVENDGDLVDLKAKADILMNRLMEKGLVV